MRYRMLDADDPLLQSDDALSTAVTSLRGLDAPERDEFLRFTDEHADALLRSCVVGHLTGSALVVDPVSERMLLLHHRKLQKWLQPGGHADGDGNLAAVALREATEETGIDGLRVVVPAIHLDIHLVEPPHEAPHLHYDVRYLVLAPEGAKAIGNLESTALRWVTLDELDLLSDEPGLRLLARRGLDVARSLAKFPR
ncbi:MAG TPA: NUDIX hydrolase [Acidimicrobiales bacterium]|nr:NUDIX hydrolase [Acidimicrobiales bacterium]